MFTPATLLHFAIYSRVTASEQIIGGTSRENWKTKWTKHWNTFDQVSCEFL